MKVLEAISDTNIGGAGILLLQRCRHGNRQKFQTTVALPKGSALQSRFREIGVDTVAIEGCRDRSLDWKSIPKWISLLKELRPDLVNCHSCLSCRIAAKLCGVPMVVDTRHCAYPPPKRLTVFPGKTVCGHLLRRLSDRTIAVAEAAKDNLTAIGVNPQKIRVIINGAEALEAMSAEEKSAFREKLGIPQDAWVVSMIARLEACKDHQTLLRAAKLLVGQGKPYRFLMVGDGSERERLQKLTQELGLSSVVLFVGFVRDVTPYWNITDIQVNCSVGTETSSLALSEGMSLGIPAVASRYGGNPYMVRNGENGYLFEMGNEADLADKIQSIGEDEVLYRRLSEGALQRFRSELNAERMTRETDAFYESLAQDLTQKKHRKPFRKESVQLDKNGMV